ncbi:JDVT-CTERM system glutamic-type intramembrane protease MrtJ [Maridesulfovibrio sp.]|uniref:JDVT-CTERM system glutamic-type intramembrane protease MrtJ n=1 Tax=unclassified Maridesulfovibrio TaxID=2794999 RepID=UPI003B00D46E
MVYDFFVNRILKGIWYQFKWGAISLTDPIFYLFLSLGFVGLYVPEPDIKLTLSTLFFKAMFEEFFFRFLLQEGIDRLLKYKWRLGPLSLANVITSATFASVHLIHQPVHWALLTFFPSLAFGYIWQRYRSCVSSTLIHFAYNAFLFYQFM